MGVHPRDRWETHAEPRGYWAKGDGPRPQTATLTSEEPGWKVVLVYQLVAVIDDRTDCFCCSCQVWSTDPHCRNHGWVGRRPCEEHEMPGTPYGPKDVGDMPMDWGGTTEIMPDSVQKERARRNANS